MKEIHGRQPWPVRIRGQSGQILGSGTLLGDRHVLTCAHVVDSAAGRRGAAADAPPATRVTIDLVRVPGLPSRRAWVTAGGWVPLNADGRGDVALLELVEPVPGQLGAELRRRELWMRRVYSFGFPKDFSEGETVHALLDGQAGPGGEQVQMTRTNRGLWVRGGFSGAAVVDEQTGQVVGMVVNHYTDPDAGRSYMIPVETILHHVPAVGAWVVGGSSVDEELASMSATHQDDRVALGIAQLYERRTAENVLVIVTGPPDSAVSATVKRAVVLSNRQLVPVSAGPLAADEDPTLPPLGSIDLALEASGKRPEELVERILTYVDAEEPTAGPVGDLLGAAVPRSVLIDGVDESTDPELLLADVVGPIVDRAADRDLRVVLGFRGPAVAFRLALLARRIAGLRVAEGRARAHRHELEAHLTGLPRGPARATRLRIRLIALRAAAGQPDPGSLPQHLAVVERETDRALHDVTGLRRLLAARASEHQQLRGLLDAQRARALGAGLTEHQVLGASYRRAHDLLWVGPCDLAEATAVVHAYADEVRSALGDRQEGEPS
ncbi:serine protease [Micromonospora sp. RTGN7]|uniref:trypsin-like serine peptidase n=1 Tax=Micromonospora sp. RTGN7 TaxID=3016526 RepID=UPI0029FECF32|nr:serine protease [Micromonospora sp. RTGN7]